MRQVFTSLRVETVEGVARLLQDAGIEVHIANGRSYHSKRGSQFSFVEPMSVKQQPSLWVKKAEDQPRARELLREAGLLASTRPGQGDPLLFAPTPTTDEPKKRSRVPADSRGHCSHGHRVPSSRCAAGSPAHGADSCNDPTCGKARAGRGRRHHPRADSQSDR